MNRIYPFLAIAACLGPLSGCAAQPVHVSAPSNQPSGISVSGSSEVEGEPDVAVAVLGVEVRSSSPEQASQELAQRMNRVVETLKKSGVAAPDIQTAQLSLYMEHVARTQTLVPEEDGQEGSQEKPAKPAPQHRATNTVSVKIRDLDRASQIITAALAAGANAMRNLRFDVEDREPLVKKARQAAMKEARENAEALAKLAGVALGAVRQIGENASYNRPSAGNLTTAYRLESADMPIERGTMKVRHTVEVTYEIVSE